MTKHEQILDYIESLSIGSKISVRKIAKFLNVSEGQHIVQLKMLINGHGRNDRSCWYGSNRKT